VLDGLQQISTPFSNTNIRLSIPKRVSVCDVRVSVHIRSRDWPLAVGPSYISTAWCCLRWEGRLLAKTSAITGYKERVCPLPFFSISLVSPLRINLSPLHTGQYRLYIASSTMSKRRTPKNGLSCRRQDPTEKSPRVVKSQKSIRPPSSNVFQKIEMRQPLGGDEAKAISALRTLLRKKKKVVVISGAGISVNAGSESFLLPLVSASLMVVAKFLIFKQYGSQPKPLLTYLFTTRRSRLTVFTPWSATCRASPPRRSPPHFIVSWTDSPITVVSFDITRRTLTASSVDFPISGRRLCSSTAESIKRNVNFAAGMVHSCLSGSVGQTCQTAIAAKRLRWIENGWGNDDLA